MILGWRRLGAYLQRGLRLLDAAQIESLGGVQGPALRSLPAPTSAETSPDYPGNWTEPYEHHFALPRIWRSDDWRIQAAAITMLGADRRRNQELFGIDTQLAAGIVISSLSDEQPHWRQPSEAVAAGLQGLRGGALNTLPCHTRHKTSSSYHKCLAPERLTRALSESNQALLEWAKQRPSRHALSAGAILHFCCDRAWFAKLGNLHVYQWRAGVLTQLAAGDEAEPQPRPHPTQRRSSPRWSRYLGFREALPVSYDATPIAAGDYYILASEGLHSTLSPHAIEQAISEHDGDLEAACMRVADIAWNSRHARADITLLLAHVSTDKRPQRKRAARQWRSQLERGLF